MKNLVKGLLLFFVLATIGCTRTIYTHDEALDKYKTKQDLAKTLGEPSEKKIGSSSEEWLYQYETRNTVAGHPAGKKVVEFDKYKRFVIFTMDDQGNVLKWYSEGVNLSEKKSAPGKTILLVVGSIAFIVILGLLAQDSVNNINLGGSY